MLSILPNTLAKFPDELRPILKEVGSKREYHLIKALTHATTREAFKNWAVQHKELVKNSALFNQMAKEIQTYDDLFLNDGGISLFIHNYVLPIFSFKNDKNQFCNDIENKRLFNLITNDEELLSNLPMIIDYIDLGVIEDIAYISKILSTINEQLLPVIHQPDTLKKLCTTFEKLSISQLICLLSIKKSLGKQHAGKGDTVLETHLEQLIPLLEKRPLHELVQLLVKFPSLINDDLETLFPVKGKTLLDHTDSIAKIFPFLKKLPVQDIIPILSLHKYHSSLNHLEFDTLLKLLEKRPWAEWPPILAIEGADFHLIFHNKPANLKKLLPFLMQCPPKVLTSILTLKNKEGLNVLHNPKDLQILIPLLKHLSTDDLWPLLTSEYNGMTLLYYIVDYKWLFPIFDKMHRKDLIKLFHIKDHFGNTLLHTYSLEKLLPYFEKFSSDELIVLFSIRDHNGKSVLHLSSCFKSALPFLKKIWFKDLLLLLSIADRQGSPVAHSEAARSSIHLLLDCCSMEQIRHVLSLRDQHGETILYYPMSTSLLNLLKKLPEKVLISILALDDDGGDNVLICENIDRFFPLLEKLPSQKLIEVLALRSKDRKFRTVLHTHFRSLIPILVKLPLNDQLTLLALTDSKGKSSLHNCDALEASIPLLEKMPFDRLVSTLSKQDNKGRSPLYFLHNIKNFLSILQKIPTDKFIEIASLQNEEGNSLLNDGRFETFLPLLKKLSKENLEKIFSIRNAAGETLLHNKDLYSLAIPLIEKHQIDLEQFVNSEGFSVKSTMQLELSPTWLTKNKDSVIVTELSAEKYNKQMAELQSNIDKLWASIEFTAEDTEPFLTFLQQKRTPEEIKKTLDEMLDLMRKEQAWLGTPPADNKHALHLFYCEMLQNFTEVAERLENKKNSQATAGHLITIATVRFEGRCASAYQAEIRQQRNLLAEKACNLDDLINQAANASLQTIIESLVGKNYGGDSHAMIQFFYAAGLTSLPDSLFTVTVENAQASILHSWDIKECVKHFGHGIPNEFAMDWLLQNTPKELGPEYLELEKTYKEKEQQLLEYTERQLLEKFPAESINLALEFCLKNRSLFISIEGLKELSKPLLLQREFDTAGQALGTALEATTFLNLETFSKADLPACMKAIESFIQKYRASLDRSADYMKKFRMAKNVESHLNTQLASILLFDEKTAGFCTSTQQLHLLKVKNEFNWTLAEFVEELSKHPLEIGCDMTRQLPSEACELARCQKYNAEVLDNRTKILIKILTKLGVVEERTV